MTRSPAARTPSDAPPQRPALSPLAKASISVLVALHVAAVFVAPLAMPPSSELSQRLFALFRPYLEAAYLDHGYAFFAPDPGPSHLVRYVLEFDDGRTAQGVFPNLGEHRPRLFYHRHFMLSEFINSAPPETPWVQAYVRSYAAHLLADRGARRVTLYLRRHLIPDPQEVLAGMRLDAPRMFEERLLGIFDPASAAAPVETIPAEGVPLGRPLRQPLDLGPNAPQEPPL